MWGPPARGGQQRVGYAGCSIAWGPHRDLGRRRHQRACAGWPRQVRRAQKITDRERGARPGGGRNTPRLVRRQEALYRVESLQRHNTKSKGRARRGRRWREFHLPGSTGAFFFPRKEGPKQVTLHAWERGRVCAATCDTDSWAKAMLWQAMCRGSAPQAGAEVYM